MKYRIMQHFISVYTVFLREKSAQPPPPSINIENSYLTPLYMYSVLLQVYCIKPQERIH